MLAIRRIDTRMGSNILLFCFHAGLSDSLNSAGSFGATHVGISRDPGFERINGLVWGINSGKWAGLAAARKKFRDKLWRTETARKFDNWKKRRKFQRLIKGNTPQIHNGLRGEIGIYYFQLFWVSAVSSDYGWDGYCVRARTVITKCQLQKPWATKPIPPSYTV